MIVFAIQTKQLLQKLSLLVSFYQGWFVGLLFQIVSQIAKMHVPMTPVAKSSWPLARFRVGPSTFLSSLHGLNLVIHIDLSSTRVPGGKRVGEDTAVFSQLGDPTARCWIANPPFFVWTLVRNLSDQQCHWVSQSPIRTLQIPSAVQPNLNLHHVTTPWGHPASHRSYKSVQLCIHPTFNTFAMPKLITMPLKSIWWNNRCMQGVHEWTWQSNATGVCTLDPLNARKKTNGNNSRRLPSCNKSIKQNFDHTTSF